MLTLSQALGIAPPPGPWFGLDANIAPAPWSAVLSIAMIVGVIRLGSWCLSLLRLDTSNAADRQVWPLVAPVVGAGFLMVVCYPLALLGVFPREVARVVALGLLALGGWQGVTWLSLCARNGVIHRWLAGGARESQGASGASALSTLLLFGLGLLALAPVTDADSLSYHVGVALAVLNSGAFPFAPEWFHSRLAGSGEVLIALGLAIGAEQFGAMLQFLGVIAVAGLLRHGSWAERHHSSLATLAFLSCPVLVAWTASPKPLLLPMAMTTIALYLAVRWLGQAGAQSGKARPVSAYILICVLVMAAATSKLNFLLSGGMVGLLALGIMWRRGLAWPAIGWGLAAFALILLPPLLWKHTHYGGALWEPLLNPFPGQWPGTDTFREALLSYRDSTMPFPLLLVIPDGLGTATTVLGVGIASLLLVPRVLREPGPGGIFAAMALLLIVIASLVGQKASRFYLEPMVWFLMALLMWVPVSQIRISAGWTWLLRGQALVTLTFIVVGVATLSIGAASSQWRHDVMSRRAYGYQAMNWLDRVAPPDARVISGIRSLGLLPRYPVSDDWRESAAGDQEVIALYENLVAGRAPDHIVVMSAVGQTPSVPGYRFQIAAGPADITMATRNPVNAGAKSQAWLLRLE